jgi:hypothetical protein
MDKTASVILAAAVGAIVSSFGLFLFNAFNFPDDIIEKQLGAPRKTIKWWALQSVYFCGLLFLIGLPMELVMSKLVCQ